MATRKNYFETRSPGKLIALALEISLLLGTFGCGYTLNHRLQKNFTSPNGFFIPVFDNHTQETGAEMVFTNALIRELQSHGEKLAPGKETGALEIRGTVTRVDRAVEQARGPHIGRLQQEYQQIPDQIGVRVYVMLEMREAGTDKIVWTKEFNAYRRVSAPLDRLSDVDAPSSLGLITDSLIENSYSPIARDMMRDAYDTMVEVF